MREIYVRESQVFDSFYKNIKLKGQHALDLHNSIKVPNPGEICHIKNKTGHIHAFSRGQIFTSETTNIILFSLHPPSMDMVQKQKEELFKIYEDKIKEYFKPLTEFRKDFNLDITAKHMRNFVEDLLRQMKDISSIEKPGNQLSLDNFATSHKKKTEQNTMESTVNIFTKLE